MAEQDTSARLLGTIDAYATAVHDGRDDCCETLRRQIADELDARQAEIERLRGELEVARYWGPRWEAERAARVAIEAERDALRARIAEAEGQAPIAWTDLTSRGEIAHYAGRPMCSAKRDARHPIALYARPIPAPAAAGVPDGMVMVPKVPTPEMMDAFKRAYRDGCFWSERIKGAVLAMPAAAPQPTAGEQREGV